MLFDSPPKNWQISTLGEICQEGGGDIQTGPFGSQLHASDYVFSGIPSIMPANIKDGRVSEEGIARIAEEDAKRLSKYLTKAGDIVYSRRGDVERCALIRKREEGWLCGTGCLRVRPGSGVVDPDFCSHFLSHPETKEWISRHAVGATMPNLNTQILSALPVLLPSLQEQKAIAHILGTLDNKIELNRKTNETLEAMAKALFKSWFVDFDPVRAKAEGRPTGLPAEISDLFPDSFEDSELGEIPSGWCVSTIGEKIKWNHGKTWEAHLRVEDSTITALGSNGIMGKSALEMGCDRIVVMGNRGSCGALNDFSGAYWVSNNAYYITEKENTYFEYWRQVLRSIDFAPFIGGSSNPFMPLKNFAHICVICPPDSMLRHFSQGGATIRGKIERIDQESAFLSQIRDALLPKLISGEIRIPDAEKMLEEMLT
ncbi:MAG: restriction endonuclease subunit S [Cyanobium sp. D14.bin.5]|jgi:type I restriction enzyme S subunit|nr:restriction endonuclease subunit S [Cyanobium sp. D14.bin.5]